MQFSIILNRRIKANAATVWQVLNDTNCYEHWNPFVVSCESTFEPGSPIIMKVNLLPFIPLSQKETVRINQKENLLEYGVHIPGLLHSSRKHLLNEIDGNTQYTSFFQLTGLLAPVVSFLMGKRLIKGFTSMTDALVERAETMAQ